MRPDTQLRRIADPALIRPVGRELPIEHVAGDGMIVIAHRRMAMAATYAADEAVLAHQRCDPLLTDGFPLLVQIFPHARVPIAPTARLVRSPDQHAQSLIATRMRRDRTLMPGIEAAG